MRANAACSCPSDRFPPLVERTHFLSAEDKNFYSHPGIDIMGIIRAALDNVPNVFATYYELQRRSESASTITQQVARDFLARRAKSPSRASCER